jgi:hypothetical protein
LPIGISPGRQIRSRSTSVHRRLRTLLAFGYGVWPVLFGGYHSYGRPTPTSTLLWMQLYIVGGIWFDNYWFWIGLAVAVRHPRRILLFAPAFFWGRRS